MHWNRTTSSDPTETRCLSSSTQPNNLNLTMDIQLLEKVSACALNRLLGYKPVAAHQILESLGNCRDFFFLPQKEREQLLGNLGCRNITVPEPTLEDAANELERLQAQGCGFIHSGQECYPRLLRECSDAPIGLYFKSRTPPDELFNRFRNISIVGTRDISPYGKEWCQRIVCDIAGASERCCIVSGLAFGVDITAHTSALESGLGTIAVLPTGIDSIYPTYHSRAAARISSTENCALITDFPPGTSPQAFTFLRRNRIIAGLSSDTILVESKKSGGGMLTAKLAFGYGRNVFCLPGRIDDPRSEGCNLLVADKIAEPIASLQKMREELGMSARRANGKKETVLQIMSYYEKTLPQQTILLMGKIYDIIRLTRGISLEDIAHRTGLQYKQLTPIIQRMESDGFLSSDVLGRCTINAKNL